MRVHLFALPNQEACTSVAGDACDGDRERTESPQHDGKAAEESAGEGDSDIGQLDIHSMLRQMREQRKRDKAKAKQREPRHQAEMAQLRQQLQQHATSAVRLGTPFSATGVPAPAARSTLKTEPVPLAQGLLQRLEASIVFEDNKLIVINKPCGIAVHGGSGLNYGVIEAFRQLRPDTKELELVHRLDRDTSGLLMIAKKRSMLRHLHAALRGDGVDKRYMALVRGNWATSIKSVRAPLQKSNLRSGERMVEVDEEGKEALTLFKVLRRFGDFATMVEAKPVTGRTHQIRVHTLHAGHCIAGDTKYGDEDFSKEIRDLGGKRLFLHAYMLTVPLPDGGELKLQAPVDEMWAKTVERLSVAP